MTAGSRHPATLKVEDGVDAGLQTRTVSGLYALREALEALEPAADPRMVFLNRLAASAPCSGHVDGLAAYGWEPGDLWGPPRHGSRYVPTSFGLLCSTFFQQDVTDSAFWPNGRALMRRLTANEEWDQILINDAVALYVGASKGTAVSVRDLLARPFPGHQAWLERMCDLHLAVVMPADDGTRFCVYARTREGLDAISGPLDAARAALERHPWFVANRHRLVWEDVWNGCLVVPDHPDLGDR